MSIPYTEVITGTQCSAHRPTGTFPVTLPLEVQRQIMIDSLDRTSSYCPKDNSAVLRRNARFLVKMCMVSHDWKDMIYPILYQRICLPRLKQLFRFMNTICASPWLGEYTVYLHYFDEVLPPKFLKVIYQLPNLKHFLTQADASTILDGDIEPSKPKLALQSLEINPGMHDGTGAYKNAKIDRWLDMSKLASLSVIGLETPNNIFQYNFPFLCELHLQHADDELDEYPEEHTLVLSILRKLGRQLSLLRLDEASIELLDAPTQLFELCPELVTLSISGLVLDPIFKQSHPKLRNLLLGDPWSYHVEARELETEGHLLHTLKEEDKEAAWSVIDNADKYRFPSLQVIILWNVDYAEEHNRFSNDIKQISETAFEKHGWLVADRFAHGRNPAWPVDTGLKAKQVNNGSTATSTPMTTATVTVEVVRLD
ncbi:hypothetical protein [Phaffia rhodozyma]|uniref:Uncharacterized protein n=1 Tax=Phaffia rhodozyma TaxID=264483 RepID=A0A0F7SK87_PHARH|nr:hypothetical protein [Phaffia rhodozyma]